MAAKVPVLNREIRVRDWRVFYRIAKDRIFTFTIVLLAILMVVPLLVILYHIYIKGLGSLGFDLIFGLPKPPGEKGGGVLNSIIGSFYLVGIASVFSVPIGIATGIYLSERKDSFLAKSVAEFMSTMLGIPSIIVGVIVYCWLVIPLKGFSALAGGIALGLMMIPVIVKSTEETLNLVPESLREASYALGVPYHRTVLKVLLPSALPGIVSGILVAVMRVLGETAPLLFTAFGNQFLNMNLLKPIDALPLRIYVYATSPYREWHEIAWGAAFLLVILVFLINILTRVVSSRWRVQF